MGSRSGALQESAEKSQKEKPPETVAVRITKRLRDEIVRNSRKGEPFWMAAGRFNILGG